MGNSQEKPTFEGITIVAGQPSLSGGDIQKVLKIFDFDLSHNHGHGLHIHDLIIFIFCIHPFIRSQNACSLDSWPIQSLHGNNITPLFMYMYVIIRNHHNHHDNHHLLSCLDCLVFIKHQQCSNNANNLTIIPQRRTIYIIVNITLVTLRRYEIVT